MRRPTLLIRLPLEASAQIALDTESHEDEQRLRSWLRRSHETRALAETLERLLDDLDASDLRRAA